MRYIAALIALPLTFALSAQAQDPAVQSTDVGEQAFLSNCAVCHSIAADGSSGPIAPNLRGVVDRQAASAAFSGYSPALREFEGAWDAQKLDAYLENPGRLVPGTRMVAVAGDANRRQAIIAYLAQND